MTKSDAQVKAAYGAWEQSRDRQRALEKLLEEAMRLHAGGGPVPSELMAEVQALRTGTDELLTIALRAINARAEERLQPGFRESGV